MLQKDKIKHLIAELRDKDTNQLDYLLDDSGLPAYLVEGLKKYFLQEKMVKRYTFSVSKDGSKIDLVDESTLFVHPGNYPTKYIESRNYAGVDIYTNDGYYIIEIDCSIHKEIQYMFAKDVLNEFIQYIINTDIYIGYGRNINNYNYIPKDFNGSNTGLYITCFKRKNPEENIIFWRKKRYR